MPPPEVMRKSTLLLAFFPPPLVPPSFAKLPELAIRSFRLGPRFWVIQMVFLLLCVAEPDKTTEKSTEKQPHGRER